MDFFNPRNIPDIRSLLLFQNSFLNLFILKNNLCLLYPGNNSQFLNHSIQTPMYNNQAQFIDMADMKKEDSGETKLTMKYVRNLLNLGVPKK
jgi:hypothetical protein